MFTFRKPNFRFASPGKPPTENPYRPSVKTASGGGFELTRFNPVYDRLEEPSIIDDWIPRDPVSLHKLLRNIYLRDPVAGPAVDLFRELPWSNFKLIGVQDNKKREIYEDALDSINIPVLMPELTAEFLVFGRTIASLIFDESKGFWTDVIIHDPDFVKIEPVPIHGIDPKLDLTPTPGLKKFISSKDPRDIVARERMSGELLNRLLKGQDVPLDPENTLFVPRKAFGSDAIGTSYYTRIFYLHAIEKYLLNATVLQAKRRPGAIRHITAGEDNWEPDQSEMDDLASALLQADEDPVGAVIVTRTGVQIGDVPGYGGQIWKISDEWGFLLEAKMKGLGISDAFLSSEAAYSTLEMAMSVFLERIRSLRDYLTKKIFYDRILPAIAKIHDITLTKEAYLAHRVRVRAGREDKDNLDLPRIMWEKQLKPIADREYLDILGIMEEKGIPVTLRTWAAAGGFDLDSDLKTLDDDSSLRKKITAWKASFAPAKEAGGGGEEGYYSSVSPRTKMPLKLWKNGRFLNLGKNDFLKIAGIVGSNGFSKESAEVMVNQLSKTLGSEKKARLGVYLLARSGVIHPEKASDAVSDLLPEIGKWVTSLNPGFKEMLGEAYFMGRMRQGNVNKEDYAGLSRDLAAFIRKSKDQTSGKYFLSGAWS